jgi:YD repeat-containing protein
MGTKILKSDLGFEIQQLLTDLENAKGTFPSLPDRLNDIEADIANTTNDITLLETKMVGITEEGNFNESFTYDENGNVTKHTVTGDIAFTIDYVYSDPVAGTLDYSEKKYTSDGKNITIRKEYSYDAAGNITGIATTTTIV